MNAVKTAIYDRLVADTTYLALLDVPTEAPFQTYAERVPEEPTFPEVVIVYNGGPADQEFDGYAIGGSLGRSKEDMHRVLEWTIPLLPQGKPRHLLGIGKVEDIFEVVKRGVDLFDCVAPTRLARTGTLLAKEVEGFRIHILNAKFKDDARPIEEGCSCYTCCNYSKAYLRHLFLAKELIAVRLGTIHNLHFLESLMRQIRQAIREKRFAALSREWVG